MCGEHHPARSGQLAGRPVHPRVCGEHVDANNKPREPLRSIPACAGNTVTTKPRSCWIAVHPRVCGEHSPSVESGLGAHRSIPACAGNTTAAITYAAAHTGPSPRVRGTRSDGGGRWVGGRSIPACAGNTSSCALSSSVLCGPSPRVRGTRRSHLGAPVT